MTNDTGQTGIVLLHGFGGTPFEMHGLKRVFADAGHRVSAPPLPGHGTSVNDWCATGWDDWADAAHSACSEMGTRTRRLFVIGLSMGGTLALEMALRTPSLAGVMTIAAPVYLYRFWPPEASDWRIPLVPLLKYIRPVWPKGEPNPESRTIAPWQGYEGVTALEPLHSFLRGMRSVKERLPQVRCPLLALHASGDRTVPASNLRHIHDTVSSVDKSMELLEFEDNLTSRHVLTTHRETASRVQQMALQFVAAHSQ